MDKPEHPIEQSEPGMTRTPPKGIRVLPRTDQRKRRRTRSFEQAMNRAMVRMPPG